MIKGHRVHVFECNVKHCKGKGNGRMVRRYLDTGDVKSTSNLRKHAKGCWGDEVVAAADDMRDLQAAREAQGKVRLVDGSITAAFERVATDKVTYSHCPHTFTEAQYVSLSLSLVSTHLTETLVLSSFVGLQKTSGPFRL
jgi:hypothetical protein